MRKVSHKQRRMTKQRKKILEVLKGTTCHPTADWIYKEVKKEIPNISLGTIYRNLNVLQEMGKIQELNYGSDYSRFDGNPENHYHFTCLECGAVLDVELEVDQSLNQMVADRIDGEVKYHRTEFFGHCAIVQLNKHKPPGTPRRLMFI
ncbi:Fur family transcriptional regulator [Halanaerobaculum tunisiense]